MGEDKHTEISKFLSYLLRHEPEAAGLQLDDEGWADVALLISGAAKCGKAFTPELIREIVANSDKKRFAISADGLRIRAVQGHSTANVNLLYPVREPPEFLYHGTATRFLDQIKVDGLRAGTRHYVHLSHSPETAIAVGRRHGRPVVLKIEALRMYGQGFAFHQAENGVWLASNIPTDFISVEI